MITIALSLLLAAPAVDAGVVVSEPFDQETSALALEFTDLPDKATGTGPAFGTEPGLKRGRWEACVL